MTAPLHERAEAYAEAARLVHAIELTDQPEADRLAEVQTVLTALCRRTDLFPVEAFPVAPGGSGGLYRLAQWDDGRGGLYVSVGVTGRGGTSPHTHAAWALVVGISGGVERNWVYERIDDGSVAGEGALRLRQEIAVGPGDVVAVPTGAFHTIEVISDTPVLHLHAYGRAVEAPGEPLPFFETPESRRYQLRAPGGSRPPLPLVEAAEALEAARAGRAALVALDGAPGVDGVIAATPDAAVEVLESAGVRSTAPVVLIGDEALAGETAGRLYRAGRPVVFRQKDSAPNR